MVRALLGLMFGLAATSAWSQNAVVGKQLYLNTNGSPLSCANGSCHGPDPRANNKNILAGANAPNVILNAISSNKGGMGFLGNAPYTVTALQAADIAAYIANPAAGTPNPAATLSTATLSFGNQVLQTTSGTMSATLTNSGSANLVLSTITLGGTNPTEFTRTGTCAPAVSLAPKASCSVDITFRPTVTGTRSASLCDGIAAVQWLADLNLKHKICNSDIPAAGRDDGLQPLFYAGKLAMLQTGSWFPTLLKNNAPDLKYALSTIPVMKEGIKPVTAFWPDCVMMFKQSKNQAQAVEFLEWMFNKDNRLAFAKQRGVIPERKDVGADPAYATGETEKYFVEQLATAVSAYDSPFPGNLYDNYTVAETLVGQAVMGEIPVADALKQAAAEIDKKNGVA